MHHLPCSPTLYILIGYGDCAAAIRDLVTKQPYLCNRREVTEIGYVVEIADLRSVHNDLRAERQSGRAVSIGWKEEFTVQATGRRGRGAG